MIEMTIRSDGSYIARGAPMRGQIVRVAIGGAVYSSGLMYEVAAYVAAALADGEEVSIEAEILET